MIFHLYSQPETCLTNIKRFITKSSSRKLGCGDWLVIFSISQSQSSFLLKALDKNRLSVSNAGPRLLLMVFADDLSLIGH